MKSTYRNAGRKVKYEEWEKPKLLHIQIKVPAHQHDEIKKACKDLIAKMIKIN